VLLCILFLQIDVVDVEVVEFEERKRRMGHNYGANIYNLNEETIQ